MIFVFHVSKVVGMLRTQRSSVEGMGIGIYWSEAVDLVKEDD